MGRQSLDSITQCVDRLFGPMSLQRLCDRGLGAMKKDDTAKLLVGSDVIFILRVPAYEIHQGERVVRVLNRLVMSTQ